MWEDVPDTDYDMLFSPSSTGYDFGFTPFEIYKDEDGNEYAYNPDTQEYYYLDSAVAPGTENVSNEELDAQLGQAYTQAGVTAPAATSSSGNAGTVPAVTTPAATPQTSPKPDILTSIANALKTPAGMAAAATALYGLSGGARPQVGGYRGTIPKYTATREQIAQPTYKPYSGETVMGRQFFTPTTYTKMAEGGIAAAPRSFYAGLNTGGIASLNAGRYLRGDTDGMADKIPSSIEGKQPAALSHGEFVIPADVVSHLGNGNSEAGANQLYKMMDRVRKARTGNSKQGKEINPDKMMPKYAQGGVVTFQAGGAPTDRSGTGVSSASPFGTTAETSLAPWVGDYVTDYLGKGQALAATPFQAYTGPLAAGTSQLQTKAFTAAEGLTPGATFTGEAVQQYMNPYLQQALEPQIAEARRQADISRSAMLGRLTKSGAYGGGRQAIMESELDRNLLRNLADITGKGYATAFDKAMNQYNIGREQTLKDIGSIASLGGQQRAVEQEGIAALQKEFEKEKAFPYQQLQFQQGLLQGLPIGTTSITPNLSDLQRFGQLGTDVTKIYDFLSQIPGFKSSGTASPGETK